MNRKILLARKNKSKSIILAGHKGTAKRPRLSVFRSNRYIYAQLVDDESGKTLVSASEKEIVRDKKPESAQKSATARLVGTLLAEKSIKKNIKKAIFDRRDYHYHGRVKQLAEGAREKGLQI